MNVPFKDQDGRTMLKSHFVHQLGPQESPVPLCPVVPHVQIVPDTHRLVVSATEKLTQNSLFAELSSTPMPMLRRWIKINAATEIMDFCGRPSCQALNGEITIQAVIRIPKAGVSSVLRMNGKDGIFMRPLHEDSDKEGLKVVLLAPEIDLMRAIRCAGRLQKHLGVVKTKKGFGVRVPGASFEEAVKELRPDEANRLLAEKFEVSGLPLYCGKEGVQALVAESKMEPVFSFRTKNTRTRHRCKDKFSIKKESRSFKHLGES